MHLELAPGENCFLDSAADIELDVHHRRAMLSFPSAMYVFPQRGLRLLQDWKAHKNHFLISESVTGRVLSPSLGDKVIP